MRIVHSVMFQTDGRAGGRPRGIRRNARGAVGTVIPTKDRSQDRVPKTVRRRKSLGSSGVDTAADPAPAKSRALADVTNVTDPERPRRGPRKTRASLKADLFEDVFDDGLAQVEREIKSWSIFQKEKTA